MKKIKSLNIQLGLFILFLFLFLAPGKMFYFLSYFILIAFYFSITKKLITSIVLVFVFSLFFDIGVGSRLFLKDPISFNLGSAWKITPSTILLAILLVLPGKPRIRLTIPDLFLLLFLFWNFFLILIWPYKNHFYGIINLSEAVLIFFALRLYLNQRLDRFIRYIFIFILILEIIIGSLQIIFQSNLGLSIETVLQRYPFGLTSRETPDIFRITGSYYNANMLSTFLLFILPFLFISFNKYTYLLVLGTVIMILFTYTRTAWLSVFLILYFISSRLLIWNRIRTKLIFLPTIIILLLFTGSFIFTPVLLRSSTLPFAFEEYGSFDIRMKSFNEGIKLLMKSPVYGIGLNMYELREYEEGNLLEMQYYRPSKKIHNFFAEIAVQTGIPGLLLFLLFITSQIYIYFKRNIFKKIESKALMNNQAAFYSFAGLIIMSMMFPVFLLSEFRLLFLSIAMMISINSIKL